MRLANLVRASAVLLAVVAINASAESGTGRALITWDGKGTIFKISTTHLLFQGDFEGIIYVETSAGGMDEAFVRCPASMRLETASGMSSGSGHCAIHAGEGDSVYAKWQCDGKPGACEGRFELVEGTGRFKGITGSSPLQVRSPLRALVTDMASGSVTQVGSGIAILSKLEYNIPNQ